MIYNLSEKPLLIQIKSLVQHVRQKSDQEKAAREERAYLFAVSRVRADTA